MFLRIHQTCHPHEISLTLDSLSKMLNKHLIENHISNYTHFYTFFIIIHIFILFPSELATSMETITLWQVPFNLPFSRHFQSYRYRKLINTFWLIRIENSTALWYKYSFGIDKLMSGTLCLGMMMKGKDTSLIQSSWTRWISHHMSLHSLQWERPSAEQLHRTF